MQNDLQRVTWREYVLVLLACVVATLAAFAYKFDVRFPYEDEFQYLGHGYSLFAFNTFAEVQDPAKALEENMFFPPLYPFFLSVLMHLDTTFANSVQCVLTWKFVSKETVCQPDYGIALWMQALLASLTMFFVWATSWRLSRNKKIAWIAVGLALISKVAFTYSNFFLTGALTLPLSAGFGWTLVRAWQDRDMRSAGLCGFFFALLVMTRAGWDYSLLVVLPSFFAIGLLSWSQKKWRAFLPLVVFVAVYGAALSPWMMRNYSQFETYSLTKSYGALSLTHRIPYNHMRFDEWAVSFIYWLPSFGDNLAAKLFDKERYDRLDFGSPNGFYTSERRFLRERYVENGAGRDLFTYYIEDEIVGNLAKHSFVSIAMVWRGMFVGKYWGLVAWLFAMPLLIYAMRKGWGALIVLSLPPLFNLGLAAFVSVSIPRYNTPLIPLLAFSMAYVGYNWYMKRKHGKENNVR